MFSIHIMYINMHTNIIIFVHANEWNGKKLFKKFDNNVLYLICGSICPIKTYFSQQNTAPMMIFEFLRMKIAN